MGYATIFARAVSKSVLDYSFDDMNDMPFTTLLFAHKSRHAFYHPVICSYERHIIYVIN